MAATATTLIPPGGHFSPELATCVCLGTRWGAVVCYSPTAHVLTHRALLPVVLDGLSYNVGAVFNLLDWPGVFAAHELFHFFVVAGSLVHYLFILKVVASFA